jgi:hypothetical protein
MAEAALAACQHGTWCWKFPSLKLEIEESMAEVGVLWQPVR